MAVDDTRTTGPTPKAPSHWQELFDAALKRPCAHPQRTCAYTGTVAHAHAHAHAHLRRCFPIQWQPTQRASCHRKLNLDRRLTPLERNAWQVFRLMLNGDGVTAFPTYEQLRPWLASMPCANKASHETVARALTLMRLTRWLSLVRRRRDPKTGRILGNLPVLHDEPLTPFEAMQLDPDYLQLVSQALGHSARPCRSWACTRSKSAKTHYWPDAPSRHGYR